MKVEFKTFDTEFLNKQATLMTIGNGYLGLRGVHDERYRNQDRGFFIRGIFDKGAGTESAELVNLPDITETEIRINGEVFSIVPEKIRNYQYYLDLETGELARSLEWQTRTGTWVKITTKRVAGQSQKHQVGFALTIEPLDAACEIQVKTGIDGQVSNAGIQHLVEEDVRIFDNQIISAQYQTIESKLTIGLSLAFNKPGLIAAKSRKISYTIKERCEKNQSFSLEKRAAVYTSLENEEPYLESQKQARKEISYQEIAADAENYWRHFWNKQRVLIESENSFDQFAIDFACYHLMIMTPTDPQYSVGAKGLTGEGYKGHVFWDTEIFIFPFFLHNQSQIAANLLEYRHLKLAGALKKAQDYGYQGALFPWESALTGFEETPKYAAINIRTGERQVITSAIAEHHIVADIAYSVNDYFEATHNQKFMEEIGKPLLEQTSLFWLSRTKEVAGRLEIHDVIGPDEYTEHVDNNAYTNYMAAFNVKLALKYGVGDETFKENCENFLEKLYYPKENTEKLIPQDDTFLTKPIIDLKKYQEQAGSQLILTDYSRQEVINMQILKQADLVMLFYLLPQLFDPETIKKNLYYYEDKTIHDSSLSKAIHAIVAARVHEENWAYEMFKSACLIDLNDQPHSSDEGIHAASLGAIWLAVIFGFAGITKGSKLEVAPRLPKSWQKVAFNFCWQGQELHFEITPELLKISSDVETPIEMVIDHEEIIFEKEFSKKRR